MSEVRPSTANKTLCCLLGCVDALLAETCIGSVKHVYPSVGLLPPVCKTDSYVIGAWKGPIAAASDRGRTVTCCSTMLENRFQIELGVCGAVPFEVRPQDCSAEDLYGRCWKCGDDKPHECDIWSGSECSMAAACVTNSQGGTEIIWPETGGSRFPSEAQISQCFNQAVEHVVCNLPSKVCACLEACYGKTAKISPTIRRSDVLCKGQYLVLSLQITGLAV